MWDGSQWSNLTSGSSQNLLLGTLNSYNQYGNNYVLLIYNNQLFVGGEFQYIFSYGNGNLSGIAMWDGQNWYGLSSNYLPPIGGVAAMTVYQSQLFMAVYYQYTSYCNPSSIIGVPLSAFSVLYLPPTPPTPPTPTTTTNLASNGSLGYMDILIIGIVISVFLVCAIIVSLLFFYF